MGTLPADVIGPVSAVAFAIAVLVITVGLARVVPSGPRGPGELAASLALGLEFFLAAGLLRLAAIDSFEALGAVAAIVLVRKVISRGIGLSLRAIGTSAGARTRA